jgi:protein FRA10AC1
MRDPTLTRARKEGHRAAFLSRREERSSGGETHTTTDLDELKKHHRFLKEEEETRARRGRGEEEEAMLSLLNEGERVAKKYEGKLFKEYAIPDLSRWDTQGVGLRWRTEKEVARGKGVDICGEKRCSERKNLGTFELNFRYKEGGKGEVKNALVKVVVCPACEEKMNRSRRRKKK